MEDEENDGDSEEQINKIVGASPATNINYLNQSQSSRGTDMLRVDN